MPRLIPVLSVRSSGTSGGGSMASGPYYADGSVSLPPLVGNYTQDSRLQDSDAGTQVASSGVSITIVDVQSTTGSIVDWAFTLTYKGTMSQTFFYWDGSAWQTMSDTNVGLWNPHVGLTEESRTATFSGVPSATIYRAVCTQSDSGSQVACDEELPSF